METRKEVLKGQYLGRVLDVGTGAGSFIPIIKDFFGGYGEIVGIDTSERGLQRAGECFNDEKIKFINMEGSHMSFEDGEFDTVCISNTLHHLEDISRVLVEMKRVLKPGGLLIINEMVSNDQSEKQMSHVHIHHLHGEIDTLLGICHRPTYTRDEILQIAEGEGLKLEVLVEYNTHDEQLVNENLEEEIKMLEASLESAEKKLESLKWHERYSILTKRIRELKESLYRIGIFGATELLILGRIK